MLGFLLENAGYDVSVLHDGRRGLEAIQASRPDAAIVDVGLPEMSGYDVAREVRVSVGGDDVLLIALTGYGRAANRAAALEAGFDEHLVKPVDPELLSRLLVTSRAFRGA